MKVSELIKELQNYLEDNEVMIAADAEGNRINFIDEVSFNYETEDDPACVCIWPM
ncbi:MAG: hypothetical protein AABY07_01220 [Nanoarchaeota archaeon]